MAGNGSKWVVSRIAFVVISWLRISMAVLRAALRSASLNSASSRRAKSRRFVTMSRTRCNPSSDLSHCPPEGLLEIGKVHVLCQPRRLVGASLAIGVDHVQGAEHVAAQHRQVIADVGDGIVDLVRHARRQPPQAGQLLVLDQGGLRFAQRLILLGQRVFQTHDPLARRSRTRSSS